MSVSGNKADECGYVLSFIGDRIFHKVILHVEKKKNNDVHNDIVS